ncbi:SRPBCC family protein [Bdellovibrio sp.]|uniref:SRPBCC family protein n=1 Tax=Bdellovibrio sp. TaxID=28201 RepID=UPI0039E299FF
MLNGYGVLWVSIGTWLRGKVLQAIFYMIISDLAIKLSLEKGIIMATKNSSNEIKITRVYDAPVKMVWDAWEDPKKVVQWWGPRGFTLTTQIKELKGGGTWIYTMHGPDGVDYPNKTKYLEVDRYRRMVYDHGGNDIQKPLFRVTVNFSEENGKTLMDMTMALPTPEAAEQTRKFIKKAGGDSTWDRLAEFLVKESNNQEVFVINRSFQAPIDVVFDAWTKAEQFSQWLSPTGVSMKFFRSDIKPGGSTFYMMTNNTDITMYGRISYKDIERLHRITYTQQFCDKDEKISRHPLVPTWPETMLTTVQFAEEAANQTRVTVTWEVSGAATPEEMKTFVESRASMTQGWTGSFDKLDNYLTDSGR